MKIPHTIPTLIHKVVVVCSRRRSLGPVRTVYSHWDDAAHHAWYICRCCTLRCYPLQTSPSTVSLWAKQYLLEDNAWWECGLEMSTDGAESPSLYLNLRIYLIESRTFIRHVRHENKISQMGISLFRKIWFPREKYPMWRHPGCRKTFVAPYRRTRKRPNRIELSSWRVCSIKFARN